jgi:DNA-binding winged helix-turn-helix (wHTH) protein/heme-degrading monooxygenase HmoA
VIVRVFRGQVHPGRQREFERHLRERGIPDFRAQPGCEAVHVGVPTPESPDEFLVVSVWRDIDALRRWAGTTWAAPKVAPDEAEMLARSWVHHYQAPSAVALAAAGEDGHGAQVLEAGPLRLDLLRRVAEVDGREHELPPKEFAVLAELARRPGQPIPSAELAWRAWPDAEAVTGEDVRRTVYRLRRLLRDHRREPPLIRNRRGHGYVLRRGSGRP